ncbi:hypothetical protein ABIE69_003078, partial [Rhodobacteraceae bacterium MBR-64]
CAPDLDTCFGADEAGEPRQAHLAGKAAGAFEGWVRESWPGKAGVKS